MMNQPREIHWRTIWEVAKESPFFLRLGATFMFVSIGAFIIFTSIFSQLDDVPKVDYDKILQEGQSAAGIITAIETQFNLTINGQHPSTISYRYNSDGTEIETKFKTMSPDQVRRLAVGDSIPVKYLHRQSIIVSLPQFEVPYILILSIPLVFFLIGFGLLLHMVYNISTRLNLYKHGKVWKAEVLSVARTQGAPISKSGQGSKLTYQYTGSTGRTYLATAFTSDLLPSNTLKQGDTIKIFVSPTNEAKSALIPRLEAARNYWKVDR
jgi:hypothetical protein